MQDKLNLATTMATSCLWVFMHIAIKCMKVTRSEYEICSFVHTSGCELHLIVCSCDQSHEQDRLNLAITMATSYDFMHIATTWLEYELMHSHA